MNDPAAESGDAGPGTALEGGPRSWVTVDQAGETAVCGWLTCEFQGDLQVSVEFASDRVGGLVKPTFRCPDQLFSVLETYQAAGFLIEYTPAARVLVERWST